MGSGLLSGLMLDLGLFKITWGVIFLSLIPARGSNPAGPYSFENISNLYLTQKNLQKKSIKNNNFMENFMFHFQYECWERAIEHDSIGNTEVTLLLYDSLMDILYL